MSSCSDIQTLKERVFEPDLVAELVDTFKVLGDATRVRILDVLSRRELNVGDIAEVLGLTESAVSHQLRLLRNARLVRQRRAGQMMFYALDDHHVIRLFAQAYEHVQERKAETFAPSTRPAADLPVPAPPLTPAPAAAPTPTSAPTPELPSDLRERER
jgi:ArsR family transcriptional regulator, lead/cadmium/zinc/bismuth-responsive transcriptional repressor